MGSSLEKKMGRSLERKRVTAFLIQPPKPLQPALSGKPTGAEPGAQTGQLTVFCQTAAQRRATMRIHSNFQAVNPYWLCSAKTEFRILVRE